MESTETFPWLMLVLPLLALLPIYFLLRYISRKTQTEDYDRRAHERDSLNCPRCQQPMEAGLGMLGRGLIWREPWAKGAGTFATITQALPNTISMNIRPAYNRAWRCQRCSTAVIDYAKMVKVS